MQINERNIDLDKAVQDLALVYAKFSLEQQARGLDGCLNGTVTPQPILEHLAGEYFAAVGYLSTQSDEFIRELIRSGE